MAFCWAQHYTISFKKVLSRPYELIILTLHLIISNAPSRFMVARHRLKRPLKRSAHLGKDRVHVSRAEAGIDRFAPKVDQDVAVMRDEMQHDDDRRGKEEERVVDEDGGGGLGRG
jgi:hypothetical protein